MINRKRLIDEFKEMGKELRNNVYYMTEEEYTKHIGAMEKIAEILDGKPKAKLRIDALKVYCNEKRAAIKADYNNKRGDK